MARWLVTPLPLEPKLISPGLVLASASSSFRFLAGSVVLATITSGTLITLPTAV